MEWLRGNWFWVLIFIVFIGMHFSGHGCGGHGGHGGHGEEEGMGHEGHGDGQTGKREQKGGHGC